MNKIKYDEAVMEIVELDFEDVLDVSTLDNTFDGKDIAENTDDIAAVGNPWA